MKRFLLVVAVLALLVPGAQQAEARTDVSIEFFYDNLNEGGNWVEVADYGYCWQPAVAVSNKNWRPYSDGYWAYTDVGWTWVSYEEFGWATYHYGRWIRLRGRGWAWVPGRDWGPAWVSWRIGGDYVGWAPLPPRRAGEYWDESPINARVDVEFDIGPASYNFIDVRYIGEPVLRERIYPSDQSVSLISQTVNVTNITYVNATVYNYGPDYNVLSRYSTRPIQRLSLQRESSVDPAAAVRSNSLMKVQGDKLVVAAPQKFQKPASTLAPKVVKEKIAPTQLERGWEPVADPKKQAELKEKFKKEDPKTVPPPTSQPAQHAAASPAPSAPRTTAAPAAPMPPSASMNQTAPTVAPRPLTTKPEKTEKPKSESAADAGPKLKKDAQERMQPPSASNPPANAPRKDEGRQKKNEPGTSPAP